MKTLEFGLDTFLPVTVDGAGLPISGDQVIRNTVQEAVIAETVGIDSFNIGEHYRREFMDSASHVILAAIASRTERIRLGTAVTVLSTQDPVRLYTDFATLDAVSNGRAQLIVGRGSLTESFPLFGFDLADYEELFEEKLDLLVRLLREQPVTWSGTFRSSLTNQFVSPPISEGHIPTWVGVGGSPQSVVRAARFGLPLMLAVIAGKPERFAPYVELYKRALQQHGQRELPIGLPPSVSSPRPMRRPSRSSGPTTRSSSTGPHRSAAGAHQPTNSSWRKWITARCMSDRPRPSRTESPQRCKRSA